MGGKEGGACKKMDRRDDSIWDWDWLLGLGLGLGGNIAKIRGQANDWIGFGTDQRYLPILTCFYPLMDIPSSSRPSLPKRCSHSQSSPQSRGRVWALLYVTRQRPILGQSVQFRSLALPVYLS